MKIYGFLPTLKYAMRNIGDEINPNFDDDMQVAAAYIQELYEKETQNGKISEEDFKVKIIEDYNRMFNESYRSADIYWLSMKYIAIKYLESHRSEIPALRKEIEKRGMIFNEVEAYTDDFYENLLKALLAIENDYKIYYKEMGQKNEKYLDEIYDFLNKYGKEDGFKKYCEKYSKDRSIQPLIKGQFIQYAYFVMFGIEGAPENLNDKSVAKFKNNRLREYITTFAERIEEDYKKELVNSIVALTMLIDGFGYMSVYRDEHAEKMKDIKLPGLKYSVSDKELKINGDDRLLSEDDKEKPNNPSVNKLLSANELKKLDIDVLLRMNSFYNNRFAKILQSYAMSLFILEETNMTMEAIKGETISSKSIDSEILKNLFIKYETLRLPIKNFFEELQKDIEMNSQNYEKQEIIYGDDSVDKEVVVIELDDFIRDITKVWGTQYENHFNSILPNSDNKLSRDILLMNTLYNSIFLGYRLKNFAMKSEYAYMYHLSQTEPDLNLNFGLVIPAGRLPSDVVQKDKSVFVASDGGLNYPNRLHTERRGYLDFVRAYTRSPLVRLYQGVNDFEYFANYITTQLLLPITQYQIKYLEKLKKGEPPKDDKVSRMHSGNEAMVHHMLYCYYRTYLMPNHRIEVIKFDKKGNPIKTYRHKVRYIDTRDGKIYTQNENGMLVGTDGQIIGMDGEILNTTRSHDE